MPSHETLEKLRLFFLDKPVGLRHILVHEYFDVDSKLLWNIILPQLAPATFIAVVVTVIGALRSAALLK